MDWQQYYQDHCVDANIAVRQIKSGDRVVVGHAVGEPSHLMSALVKNRDHFQNVEIVHMVCMGKGEYCLPGMEKHFRHNSLFVGGPVREANFAGRADFTPCYFSEIPYLFTNGYLPVNVALIQVSPPDHTGHCSLGVSVDYTAAAAESASIVIAQVNKYMPRTLGDSFIHVKDINWFVNHDEPLIQLSPIVATDVEKSIAHECAKLIDNGSTLQLGIGSLPDAVLNCIKDKKDLGIHSEMISDGVANLVDLGVINCSEKTLMKGKIVVAFMMGTRNLYDFVHDNPMIHMAPVNWVNDPYIIRQNENMISINSCVQVDLMGQVCSESIGLKQISAVGGQVDFVRGANMSKGGKSIIALPSTANNGKTSKIVPFLDQGATVTTSRADVSYVITEYGIASLKGKTLRERAKLLISIAHPDFRPMLIEEWERRFRTAGEF